MITNINETLKVCGIYKITYDNGKIYIGQALSIWSRANEHNSKNVQLCDKALKKHAATIEVLEIVSDITLLDEIESKWITYYNSTNKNIGYNILEDGNASGKKGTDNCNASFNESQINEIVDLLINSTKMSYKDIAKQYNVDPSTILNISHGYTYFNPKLSYPLRKYNHDSIRKDEVLDYFKDEKELLNLKNDLYYRWDLEIERDLTVKYNIPLRILRKINQGEIFQDIGEYQYPIRNKNIRNNCNFTNKDILNILSDLRNTTLSMSDIGIKYNMHRSTISKINKGESYIIKDYDYPARNEEQIKNNYTQRKTKPGRQVQCLNTMHIFDSIIEAAKWCNVSESCIRACANGKQKTSGKHPETKESLKWEWIS